MAGRTAHGTLWRRTPTLLESERGKVRRQQNLARYHRRTARRAGAGLNSRGTPYRTRVVERAWRRLRATMHTPCLEIWTGALSREEAA
jgi:hypothetical protein